MTNKLTNYLLNQLKIEDVHTIEVAKKSFSSIIVKAFGMIIGFAVSIYVARNIGAEGVGVLALSNKIIQLLITLGLLGMTQIIIKEVAIAYNKNNFQHVKNVMNTAYWISGSITFVISIILILISPWLANVVFDEPRLKYPLIVFAIVLLPQVMSRIFSSGLIGYKKIWQSNLVQNTLSVFVTAIVLLFLWVLNFKLNVNNVALSYALGRITVTLIVGIYWLSLNKYDYKAEWIGKRIIKTSLPLFLVAVSGVIINQFDVLILGLVGGSEEVGLYSVASRLSLLTIIFLQVANSSISPKIAALYSENKKKELELMIQKTTKILAFLGLVPLVIFILFGSNILYIWGSGFDKAYFILLILSIGQFINTASGSVGKILIMSGNEVLESKITIFFASWGIIQSLIMGCIFGIYGVAISQAINISAINIVKAFYIYKKLKIDIFGFSNYNN